MEKEIELKLKEKIPPKVLKEIGMRDGEIDVRQLNDKDYRQLEFRLLTDIWQFMKASHDTQVTQTLILLEIAKKLGVENIHEILDEKLSPEDSKEA